MRTINLFLDRFAKKEKYTIGKLFVDQNKFCDTIEDKVRVLGPNGEGKIWGKTAIPAGKYKVTIAPTTIKLWPEYIKRFGNVLPLLHNVPFFSSIRLHHGTTEENSEGCPIVGKNKEIGKVLESRNTLFALMEILTAPDVKEIWIEIK